MGNIGSLINMFRRIGVQSEVASDVRMIEQARKVMLPGVGAFGAAMDRIDGTLQRAGKQIRISARLVSAKNGVQLWSERFDGQLEDVRDAPFDEPLSFVDNPDLTIGAFVGGSFPASGSFDEVAVWRRALDDDELRALWLRGMRRLGLQVRTCEQPDCGDDPPFFGDTQGPFVDTVQDGPQTSFDFGPSRYLQYSVEMGMEAAASNETPRLLSVTVGASP